MNSVKEEQIQRSISDNGVYTTQKHHIIPAGVLGRFTTLVNNIKLIDWDINSKNNGICLPYFLHDIKRHGLQCHRGNHPKEYNTTLAHILEAIEEDSKAYCTKGKQDTLHADLDDMSSTIRGKILNWSQSFLLRGDAAQEKNIYGGYKR